VGICNFFAHYFVNSLNILRCVVHSLFVFITRLKPYVLLYVAVTYLDGVQILTRLVFEFLLEVLYLTVSLDILLAQFDQIDGALIAASGP